MIINFWPTRKFWKLGLDKGSVGYTTTLNYHDFLDKQYFFPINLLPINPQLDSILPKFSDDPLRVTITINPMKGGYEKYYNDIKEWTTINFFKSNYLSKNSCCGYTYWNVENVHSIMLNENGDIVKIKYDLVMDSWSTYFDTFWNIKGTMEINRMHNNRFKEDEVYGTNYLIPNLSNNSAIRNCDDYCKNINDKIQIGDTRYLISNRTFDVKEVKFKETIDTKDGNKYYAQLVYVSKSDNSQDPYWTVIDKQVYPFKIFLILWDVGEIIDNYSVYDELRKKIEKTDTVQYSNIFDFCFHDSYSWIPYEDLENVYRTRGWTTKNLKEILYYHDEYDILKNHFFFDKGKIVNDPLMNPNYEPHLASYSHTHFQMGCFGSNQIDFDLISFFVQNKKQPYPINIEKGLFPLAIRIPTINPEQITYNNYLLNNDTTLENKMNNGLMNAKVNGAFKGTWWTNAYIEFMKQNINQKEAGMNKIDVKEQSDIRNNWSGFTEKTMGAAGAGIGGALALGALGGPIGLGIAGAMGLGGVLGSVVGGATSGAMRQKSIRENAQADRKCLNAFYEDAKFRPNNISVEGNNQVGEVLNLNSTTKPGPYQKEKLFLPKVSSFTLREEERYNVALYINKFGYPQKRTLLIDNLNDLMVRRNWNYLKISNMYEQCLANGIPLMYASEFVEKLIEGVHFINMQYLPYEAFYRWELNNPEICFDKALAELEEPLYGPKKKNI